MKNLTPRRKARRVCAEAELAVRVRLGKVRQQDARCLRYGSSDSTGGEGGGVFDGDTAGLAQPRQAGLLSAADFADGEVFAHFVEAFLTDTADRE
jgi:hypothetical protein